MSLLFVLYQNDATIQIVIATEECKQDTYALLIYNSTVESNDEVHIGFSSGIHTIQTIIKVVIFISFPFLRLWQKLCNTSYETPC